MKKKKITAYQRKETSFLEALSIRCPDDPDILKALGDLYTATGRFEDGFDIDRKLTTICPEDPVVWYNHACSCALLGLADQAFTSLEQAIELGYNDFVWMTNDSDLDSLKSDERFKKLVEAKKHRNC